MTSYKKLTHLSFPGSRAASSAIRNHRRLRLELLEKRQVLNGTYHILADGNFQQDWLDPVLLSVDDDWNSVPSIIGYRGDNLTTATGVDPQTVLAGDDTPVVDVIANQTNPNALISGGVAEFEITDPVVAFQGSGTADAPYLLLHMNSSGRSNIRISYKLRDIDGSADNSIQQVALQFRVGSTGAFTNVPSGYVADASSGPSLATLVTDVSATLPASASDQAELQVRIMTTNAIGNDEWIGVDDILVSSEPLNFVPDFNISIDPGSAVQAEGDTGTTTYSYTVTRGGDTTIAATVDWVVAGAAFNALAPADNGDFAGGLGGTLSFGPGVTSMPISVTIVGDTLIELDEGFSLTLQNATPANATISTPLAQSAIVNDDVQQTLQAGDVVVTAIGTTPNPDRFAFVPLVDLVEGLEVKFTDNGWDGAAVTPSLTSSEGTIVFTVPAGGLAKNSKVIVSLSSDGLTASVQPASAGSASVIGNFALNGTGDSIIAYTGSPRLASTTNSLFAVNTNVSYLTTGTIAATSTYLPPGLTIGQSAVEALGTLLDPDATVQEGQYNHSLISGSASNLLAAVANVANWTVDNDNAPMDINASNFSDGTVVGVSVSQSGGSTSVTEGGSTDTYTIVLTSRPIATVTISINPGTQVTVAPNSLVFTATNWDSPQTVTVTAVDDQDDEGAHTGTISHSVASADANYNGLAVPSIDVAITDNDRPLAEVRLNEIYANPPGNDDAREYIEIRSTSDIAEELAGLTLIILEGDGTAAGSIDAAVSLNTFSTGNNGLLLLGSGYPGANPWAAIVDPETTIESFGTVAIENGTITFLLVGGFSGSLGVDLDVDNDGNLDSVPWQVVLDSVGWTDGGATDFVYSPAVLTQATITPDAATRIENDLNAGSLDSWFNSDILIGGTDLEYDPAVGSTNLPLGAVLTPGDANYRVVTQAGVTVTPNSGLSTTEDGGTATFTLVLDTPPTDNVTIPVSSSNLLEGTVSVPSVIFTSLNWNVPQSVIVTGVNDQIDDGDQFFQVVLGAAESFDFNYGGLNAPDISVTNADDDTFGIAIAPVAGLTTTEVGGTATFTIVLQSEPTSNVSIGLSSSNTAEGTIDATELTFSPANWSIPQTVTITGADDTVVDGDIGYSVVTAAAVSADANYQGLDAADVSVINLDNDVAGPAPQVSQAVFGDGTAQRSMVRQIVISFDSEVVVEDGAFVIERREGGPPITIVQSISLVDGKSVATLRFNGDNVLGGSLEDGNYSFRIVASKIRANGMLLDGNGDGTAGDDYSRGTEATDNFYRLYGDIDGTRQVSVADFNAFRASFGRSNDAIDFDGNGTIGPSDFNEFRRRFGRSI